MYHFTEDISKAYCNWNSVGQDKVKHGFAYECYYCRKFFTRTDRHKNHLENCAGVPGVIYNFNNKNLISFQDNFNVKGNLHLLCTSIWKQLPQQKYF